MPEQGQKRYTNADVGIRGDRPFRVCATHWDRNGVVTLPGDDPEAPVFSSRVLENYATGAATDQMSVSLHEHEFYEFAFIRSAKRNYHVTEQGSTPLWRGDVIVMAPGAFHGFSPMGGLWKTDLFLQPQWLSEELRLLLWEEGLVRTLLATSLLGLPVHDGRWVIRLAESEIAACEAELDCIIEEAYNTRPSLALYNGCFLKLLSIVNRGFVREKEYTPLPISQEIWQVVTHIEEAIDHGDDLSLDDLARAASISRRHLMRVFRAAAGMSVSQYYQERRIQVASRMLSQPHASITAIAHRLNFSDLAHFIRVFRSRMGATPGEFRKAHVLPESTDAAGQHPAPASAIEHIPTAMA